MRGAVRLSAWLTGLCPHLGGEVSRKVLSVEVNKMIQKSKQKNKTKQNNDSKERLM